jgi:predicted solute-binding protein
MRLGVVPYLNVAPIIHGLAGDPELEIIPEVPSRLAERLHAGEIDLGMIPSIEYAMGEYAIVPGIAIGSNGPVRSVRLFHRQRLEDASRVALDASSRTSVALLKVLLRERLGRDPEYVTLPPSVPDMLRDADAALLIGDPALYYKGDVPSLDLGEEWGRLTGRPFVFAFWAGRPGAVSPAQVVRLQHALQAGLAAVPAIAASYNGLGAGRGPESEAYLRHNIVYSLGEGEIAGLREFYRRAHAAGLIPRIPELRFHGDP